MTEHDDQANLFQWADLQKCTMPELGLLFAIPNGGHRHAAVGKKMKDEGVKKGMLDAMLPVARHDFHGLFIEMKFGKNKPTKEQDEWLFELEQQGYLCAVCYGFEPAKEILEWYLGSVN